MPHVFDQMVAVVEKNPQLLTCFRNDLYLHDQESIAESFCGDTYVWILRECGTELIALMGQQSTDPLYWQQHFMEYLNPKVPKCAIYFIEITFDGGMGGQLTEIPFGKVSEFFNEKVRSAIINQEVGYDGQSKAHS